MKVLVEWVAEEEGGAKEEAKAEDKAEPMTVVRSRQQGIFDGWLALFGGIVLF